MAFKFVKRNKLTVAIKGTLPDENGKSVNFDFKLHCKRLTQDEIESEMKDRKGEVRTFSRNVIEGWESMFDEDGTPMPFSSEQLDELLKEAGMPVLIMHSYLEQIAATAKN